jgi:hypothetical protein
MVADLKKQRLRTKRRLHSSRVQFAISVAQILLVSAAAYPSAVSALCNLTKDGSDYRRYRRSCSQLMRLVAKLK